MNIIIWILTLSLLLGCFYEAHLLSRGTVCLQEAWLRATEGRTRSLIIGARSGEIVPHSVCEGKVLRQRFDLHLQGYL